MSDLDSAVEFAVEPEFAAHFKRLQQVFLYINDDCNLACKQCIYKPHVVYNEEREIPPPIAIGLLRSFRDLGAWKLTLLGGEPTLYGLSKDRQPLGQVLRAARTLGFSYLRLDTNGHFPRSLFESALDHLDELAFSIDGFDPVTNDKLRGEGTFRHATKRLSEAVERGITTSITCCIHNALVDRDEHGDFGVERVIRLGEEFGVDTVNFHDLFKAGVPMDSWTGSFDTTVEQHLRMYNQVRRRIEAGAYSVKVRLPQCFVTRDEFERNPEYYGYCPVKMGERVMVHSDGVIRICSNLICSSFGTARYEGSAIRWNRSRSNELLHHELRRNTPCTNRSKNASYDKYVPLCFSFKPDQEEPVWSELSWDDRRTVDTVPELAPTDGEPPRPVPLPMLQQ